MFDKLLIANRGEIAIRILHSAHHLGIRTLAVYTPDDRQCLHAFRADESAELDGTGAAGYLDIANLIAVARAHGCDAVHPGYGFLSESPAFAAACEQAGITFVGPDAETLSKFGDKAAARQLAIDHDVPVLPGTTGRTTLDAAREFLHSHAGPVMLKAIAGGGGRGVRRVDAAADLADAFERCASEARSAFGDDGLYVEACLSGARHIEVQVLGDSTGNVMHLGERDCSLQRRHQKIIEIAPAPGLPDALRTRITGAAVQLAGAARYTGAGTVEFLVDVGTDRIAFIEANARLQVEHTITEVRYGIDLVEAQLRLAAGAQLSDLAPPAPPVGIALQLRVNMETMEQGGGARPGGGTITAFDPPSGPGLRLDTYAYTGYTTNPRFDSLLAKLIVHHRTGDMAAALASARRALAEFRIEGVPVNIHFLTALLRQEALVHGSFHTRFVDEVQDQLIDLPPGNPHWPVAGPVAARRAGFALDSADPLAVLDYGQSTSRPDASGGAADDAWLLSPMQGTIIEVTVRAGEAVRAGQCVAIMDSMKMEHEVSATVSGVVTDVGVSVGDTLFERQPLLRVEPGDVETGVEADAAEIDPATIRPDLDEVMTRRATTLDAGRPAAVQRRRDKGQRTARENVDDLCDPGTFVEYGQLVLAAQRRRRSIDELIEKSPADGMITGVGAVNGALFDDPANRCVVMAYDYTVFAGTQGGQNHRKTDRMIGIAEDGQMPTILFAEGGGGRPGDTDGIGGAGGNTFARFAQLSGLVPMVGITSGRCFAGNASLLGCCDVIIATEGANIGMGGPAMIEGGGLGVFAPEEIGPMSVQVSSGVVDLLVADEAEAVRVAKQYLGYFQGVTDDWRAHDQRELRHVIPENRLRVYDVRRVISTLADAGSMLELRAGFGVGAITCLVRIEGRPLGIIANNPAHLGGAIDSDGADKSARFMQLCDAFDVPILYLCDTPGIMVGPEIEKTALVRHSSRMFITGANLSVPFFTIVLRKAYGLGAIAMAGGSYKTPYFSVAWPTGEFGGMGLEGSVKLGYRNELAAIEDPDARLARYEEMVERAYANGKALNYASLFSVDDTIDPADSRFWVASLMKSIRTHERVGKKRPAIDAW